MSWLPEIARIRPRHALRLEYLVSSPKEPVNPEATVPDVLRASSPDCTGNPSDGWEILVPLSTRVYGFVPREIDEKIDLRMISESEQMKLVLVCRPTEFHSAHAAGFAGVLAIASVAWFAEGLTAGVLPALATVIAGGLMVEVTRHWALEALERRLHLILEDIGRALWPKASAQIVSSIDLIN